MVLFKSSVARPEAYLPSRENSGPAPQCFYTSEIYSLIAQCVYDSGRGKGSLASLAMTRRECFRGAIALIWAHMNSLRPLMKLLPVDGWFDVHNDDGSTTLDLLWRGDPDDINLSRLKFYAAFVKRFEWNNNNDVSMRALAFFFRHTKARNSCLFTHVNSFSWLETRDGAANTMGMIWPTAYINSHITDLRLAGSTEDSKRICKALCMADHLRPQLQVLHIKGPALEHSYAHPGPGYPHTGFQFEVYLGARLSEFVYATNLREFRSICPLSMGAVIVLASMPLLECVEFRPAVYHLPPCKMFTLPAQSFPSVKVFYMHLRAMTESSKTFMETIASTQLHLIALWVDSHPGPDLIRDHFDVFDKSPFRAALRQVYLYLESDVWYSPAAPPAVTISTLQPLVNMQWLTDVVIYAAPMRLCEDDMHLLAASWPHLRTLWLMPINGDIEDSLPVPLNALVAFAERAKALETVGFLVDPKMVPNLPPGWRSSSRVHRCVCFPGEDVTDNNALRIQSFLTRIFPVFGEQFGWGQDSEYDENIDDVETQSDSEELSDGVMALSLKER